MRRIALLALVLTAGCLGTLGVVPVDDGPGRPRDGSPNDFALDVYARLGANGGNVFFSPTCIREAFAIAHAGARGDTAAEMAAALRLPDDPAAARRAVAATRPRVGGVKLHQAAAVWGQRGYGFQRSFLGLLGDGYGAAVHEVDFQAGDAARKTINAWVERQTADKIKDLFPRPLGPQTRLALVSAIYFKGDWVHPFEKDATRDDDFHVSRTEKARVRLMHQTETFGYAEAGDCQVLRMPYVGREIDLLAVLPRDVDGLPAVEKTLTAEALARWAGGMTERKVHVYFPRFEMSESFDLTGVLSSLGMKLAFQPGSADFGGMNGGKEPLHVSAAVHKAWIDLNELGTEAAAATGIAIAGLAMPLRVDPTPTFRADHPFLFAIRDTRTGAFLFLGRYARP